MEPRLLCLSILKLNAFWVIGAGYWLNSQGSVVGYLHGLVLYSSTTCHIINNNNNNNKTLFI